MSTCQKTVAGGCIRWCIAALLLSAAGAVTADDTTHATIRGTAKVLDGDSLEISGQRIRLWGIDALEYQQTCQRDGKPWNCGADATRALRQRVSGRRVICEPVEFDRYGRAVARCAVDGESLNQWIVQSGWALDYARYSGGRFARAQAQAKATRRGIWSGSFQKPDQYRRQNPR